MRRDPRDDFEHPSLAPGPSAAAPRPLPDPARRVARGASVSARTDADPELALWPLVERRAAATPDALFAVDERAARSRFAAYRDAALRGGGGAARARRRRGDARSPGSCRRASRRWCWCAALARLGAVQNPILPIYREREVGFIARQSGARLLVVPRGLPRLRPRGDGAQRSRASTPGPRGARRRRARCPRAIPRRCRPPPQPPRLRERAGALDLLHLGHDRRPEGRAAHRRVGRRAGRAAGRRASSWRRTTATRWSSRSRTSAASAGCSRACWRASRRSLVEVFDPKATIAVLARARRHARRRGHRVPPGLPRRAARARRRAALPARARLPGRRRAEAAAAPLRGEARARRRRDRRGLRPHRVPDRRR